MSWHDGPLAGLDLEATGVDPDEARIVEVGLFRFQPDGSSSSLVDRMIDPGVALPAEVSTLTGIRPEDLATMGGDPAEVLAETRAAIFSLVDEGIPIVVFNATYDWSLLATELARHGLDSLPAVPPQSSSIPSFSTATSTATGRGRARWQPSPPTTAYGSTAPIAPPRMLRQRSPWLERSPEATGSSI